MRLLVVLTAAVLASADPIIIRSGLKKHKDAARRHDANVFDLSKSEGAAAFEGDAGFDHDSAAKHVEAADAGKYGEDSAVKKISSNANDFVDDKFHQQAGGDVAEHSKKSANKKGHHKAGYSKTFHKDESASTSSYYDDADDEDNQFEHHDKKNFYGDAGQHVQRGSDLDDRRYLQEQGKKGHYNNAGNYDRDFANRRDYHGRRYYDKEENLGRRNAANQYGEDGRYGEERYVKRPYYYHDPDPYYDPPLLPAKKTITIYEDPRYDGFEKYPPYDNDYIQLELKRPPRDYDYKYYERRPPPYDDYYY